MNQGELVRCAGCGVRGRWEGASVVNAEDHWVDPLCPGYLPKRRGHFAESVRKELGLA